MAPISSLSRSSERSTLAEIAKLLGRAPGDAVPLEYVWDHRGIKRRVNASQGLRSFDGAWKTIQGYEVLHMIRKGQVRRLPKDDVLGLIQFIREILGWKS